MATQTFRAATNAHHFLPKAEATLGFPIDIIGGHEEARLIYLGVAHVLPASNAPRLVIDIGGGSTEFIIGRGMEPERLESLKLGCVGVTQRFFPKGELTAAAFKAAETHARAEIEAIANQFDRAHWHEAFASSGTALALAEILESNGWSSGGITPEGLARLRSRMISAGHVSKLTLEGLKPARAPVLAGGFAVMTAALAELRVERINPVGGALRLGVLYDLLGRTVHRDSRVATVERFLERYRIDREHAQRVAATAKALYLRAAVRPDNDAAQRVEWAGWLHEVGFDRVAHRVPQAQRVHPAARGHAGILRGRAARHRAARARLSRRARQGRRRARRSGRASADPRASARGAVPSRASPDRNAAHHARGQRDDPPPCAGELAQGASRRPRI